MKTSSLLALDISKEPVHSLDAAHADGRTAFPYIVLVQVDFRPSGQKADLDVIFSSAAVRVTGHVGEVERAYHAARGGFLSTVRADPGLGIDSVEIIRRPTDDEEGG